MIREKKTSVNLCHSFSSNMTIKVNQIRCTCQLKPKEKKKKFTERIKTDKKLYFHTWNHRGKAITYQTSLEPQIGLACMLKSCHLFIIMTIHSSKSTNKKVKLLSFRGYETEDDVRKNAVVYKSIHENLCYW